MATQLENLSILLSNEDCSASKGSLAEILLPTNEDAIKVLSVEPKDKVHQVYQANELCVNIWNEAGDVTWYLGYFNSMKADDLFVVEQLVRVDKNSDLMWIHPVTPILEDVDASQVLRLKNGKRFDVKGAWNCERKNKLILKNKDEITKEFQSIKTTFIENSLL